MMWRRLLGVWLLPVVHAYWVSQIIDRQPIVYETGDGPRAFLQSQPDGAYTVIRVQGNRIWGLSFHLQRLVDSLPQINDPEGAKRQTKKLLKFLLERRNTTEQAAVTMLTVLWYTLDGTLNVVAHCGTVPATRPLPLRLKIADTTRIQRRFPQRKSSSWCTERVPLEQDGFDEIILATESGDLLEGFTSNLFGIDASNRLWTAPPDRILNGYVRNALVDEFPVTQDYMELDGMKELFCTSSIRIVVPVQTVTRENKVIWESTGKENRLYERYFNHLLQLGEVWNELQSPSW